MTPRRRGAVGRRGAVPHGRRGLCPVGEEGLCPMGEEGLYPTGWMEEYGRGCIGETSQSSQGTGCTVGERDVGKPFHRRNVAGGCAF